MLGKRAKSYSLRKKQNFSLFKGHFFFLEKRKPVLKEKTGKGGKEEKEWEKKKGKEVMERDSR